MEKREFENIRFITTLMNQLIRASQVDNMQFPCEVLVKNILPAIRAIMVKELKEKHGKTQKEIAQLMGITQPSVSYYLHGERGGAAIELIRNKTKDAFETIIRLVDKLVAGNISTEEMIREICGICMVVRPLYIEEVCPEKFEFIKEWNICFKE